MRDKVIDNQGSDSDSSNDVDEEFAENTDLQYYTTMNPNEKLMTLNNRAQKLIEK